MFVKEGYPLDWLKELKDRNNIIEVVSRYVPLTQKGGNFWGCCPFHHEKTASFSVKDDGQFYHCFGCGESGDVITFLQKIEGLTFPEAVAQLAERAGMEVPNKVGVENAAANKKKRDRLYEILSATAKFYHECLMSDRGLPAREYLEGRGIGKALQVRFGLGYCPDFNSSINRLRGLGYTDDEIAESGVGWRGKTGAIYDALKERMIVPIIDGRGRVVAFSGRIVEKDYHGDRKYMHFRNTTLFEKSKVVYAANFVKNEKRKAPVDKVIIVEGYTDVISLAKYGFNNAVAGMGTAFTPGQAREIHGLSDNVYVCYDGDAAGQNAAWKNLTVLHDEGLNLHIVTIPDAGMDPDEYVKKYGREGFDKLLKNALPYMEYVLTVLAERQDMNTNTGRAKYVKEAIAFINKNVSDKAGRDVYLEIVSDKSRVPLDVLRDSVDEELPEAAFQEKPKRVTVRESFTPAETAAARFALYAMLTDREYVSPSDITSEEVFENEVHKNIYRYITAEYDAGRKPAAHMLYTVMQDEEVANILSTVKEFSDENKFVKFYRDSVKLLNGSYLNFKLRTLSQAFDAATGEDKRRLFEKMSEIQRKIKEIK